MAAEDLATFVGEAQRRVANAVSLQEAIVEILPILRDRYDITRAHIMLFTEEGTARVVAGAPAGEGFFGSGAEVSLNLTPGIQGLVGRLMLGHGIVVDTAGKTDLGLLTPVLLAEGVSQGVALPLRRDGAVLGVMTLGTPARGTFGGEDLELLEHLASELEDRLLALAGG